MNVEKTFAWKHKYIFSFWSGLTIGYFIFLSLFFGLQMAAKIKTMEHFQLTMTFILIYIVITLNFIAWKMTMDWIRISSFGRGEINEPNEKRH